MKYLLLIEVWGNDNVPHFCPGCAWVSPILIGDLHVFLKLSTKLPGEYVVSPKRNRTFEIAHQ